MHILELGAMEWIFGWTALFLGAFGVVSHALIDRYDSYFNYAYDSDSD